jgi:hypothetical protein
VRPGGHVVLVLVSTAGLRICSNEPRRGREAGRRNVGGDAAAHHSSRPLPAAREEATVLRRIHAGTAPSSAWWRMRMWREGLRGSCMLLCFLFPRPTSPSAFRRTRNYPALRLFPTARSRNIAQKAHNELDAKDEGRPPDTPTPCQAETRNTDRVLVITEYERGRIART